MKTNKIISTDTFTISKVIFNTMNFHETVKFLIENIGLEIKGLITETRVPSTGIDINRLVLRTRQGTELPQLEIVVTDDFDVAEATPVQFEIRSNLSSLEATMAFFDQSGIETEYISYTSESHTIDSEQRSMGFIDPAFASYIVYTIETPELGGGEPYPKVPEREILSNELGIDICISDSQRSVSKLDEVKIIMPDFQKHVNLFKIMGFDISEMKDEKGECILAEMKGMEGLSFIYQKGKTMNSSELPYVKMEILISVNLESEELSTFESWEDNSSNVVVEQYTDSDVEGSSRSIEYILRITDVNNIQWNVEGLVNTITAA